MKNKITLNIIMMSVILVMLIGSCVCIMLQPGPIALRIIAFVLTHIASILSAISMTFYIINKEKIGK